MFDCGDADLNNFLLDDAVHYLNERMAVTYTVELHGQLLAYYCLLNDKVTFDTSEEQSKSIWNRFNRKNKIPNPKRRKNYPAVKVGRLAVNKSQAGQGLGRFILDSIKVILFNKNDVACRFLTVDAYSSAFEFYKRNGFEFLTTQDEKEATRVMYFDLKRV
jgi:predicted GNAT family N-acyltransferase